MFTEITPLETLDQALEMLDYEAFRKEQAEARAEGRLLGLGLSVYVEPTSMGGPTLHTEGCTVRVESSGKVVAFLGTTSHGQSVETTMAQVVADTLGVGYDDVTVVQADTQSTPYGPGTGGSRTAVIAGGAARAATLAVRDKVLQVAAHAMEASPDDLEIERQHGVGAGHADQVEHVAARDREDRVRQLRHAAARAHERARSHRAVPSRAGSPRGRTRRTRASSRSTPTRGCPR